MSDRNHLSNGRLLHDLDNWTASNAVYSAGDGDDHYGVAALSASGGYIEQTFSVSRTRSYTLHTSVKPVGGILAANEVTARIQDGAGNTVATLSLEGGTQDTWQENEDIIGLAPGTTYTLRITNASALPVRVDDVWLWHVPITRAAIASRIHAKLGRLASDLNLSTISLSRERPEGDYTYAVDTGLRAVGAIDPETGSVNARYLEPADIDTALETVEREMMERLHRDYMSEVDVSLGPRREQLSQKAAAIEKALGGGGAGGQAGRIVQRRLTHGHGFPED